MAGRWATGGEIVCKQTCPPTEVVWTHVDIKKYFQDRKFG